VRSALLAVGIAVALGATGGVAYLALRERGGNGRESAAAKPTDRTEPDEPASDAPALSIRAYETFRTLAEDLRDALARDPEAVQAAWTQVHARLAEHPAAMLQWIGRNEPSPRVRALMVLAAGAHVPDEPALLLHLGDAEPVVRRAAVLAAAYAPDGAVSASLLGVRVPLGRALAPATRALLAHHARSEGDETVNEAIRNALG